jgi:hypothetical protein
MFDATKTGPFCMEIIEAIEYRYCEHDLDEPVAAQPQTLITAPATTNTEQRHRDLAHVYGAWGRMVRERRRQRGQYLRTVIGSNPHHHR